jgi:hypothetical protein
MNRSDLFQTLSGACSNGTQPRRRLGLSTWQRLGSRLLRDPMAASGPDSCSEFLTLQCCPGFIRLRCVTRVSDRLRDGSIFSISADDLHILCWWRSLSAKLTNERLQESDRVGTHGLSDRNEFQDVEATLATFMFCNKRLGLLSRFASSS